MIQLQGQKKNLYFPAFSISFQRERERERNWQKETQKKGRVRCENSDKNKREIDRLRGIQRRKET
jgi:hypothetical protein